MYIHLPNYKRYIVLSHIVSFENDDENAILTIKTSDGYCHILCFNKEGKGEAEFGWGEIAGTLLDYIQLQTKLIKYLGPMA